MSKLTEPAAYLLTWNPDSEWATPWETIAEFLYNDWSTRFNYRKMKVGDHLWFLRQGQEPRGIFGHAVVMKPAEYYPDYDSYFVLYWMDWLVDPAKNPQKMIRRDLLINDPLFNNMHWDTQGSGPLIPPDINNTLRERVFGE